MDGTDLMSLDPGGDVGVGPEAVRPEPTAEPGEQSGGWTKVGAGHEGGSQWPYVDSAPAGGDAGPWKQT